MSLVYDYYDSTVDHVSRNFDAKERMVSSMQEDKVRAVAIIVMSALVAALLVGVAIGSAPATNSMSLLLLAPAVPFFVICWDFYKVSRATSMTIDYLEKLPPKQDSKAQERELLLKILGTSTIREKLKKEIEGTVILRHLT